MSQEVVDVRLVNASMRPHNGYDMSFAGGEPMEIYHNLMTNDNLPVVFNGKGEDQQAVADAMDRVHLALTTAKALPFSARWQIYAIETTSAPQLIGREENRNWLYGSSFRVKFYQRGANNG